MRQLTKAQILENQRILLIAAQEQGRQTAKKELAHEFSNARLQQMQAAVKLLEEAGRLMSRAGYMVGKINQDNSR